MTSIGRYVLMSTCGDEGDKILTLKAVNVAIFVP